MSPYTKSEAVLRLTSTRKARARGSTVRLRLCAVLVAGHAGCRSVSKSAPDDGKVGDGQPSLTEKPPMEAAAAAKPALPSAFGAGPKTRAKARLGLLAAARARDVVEAYQRSAKW